MTRSAFLEGAVVGRRIDDRTHCIFPAQGYLLAGPPGRYQEYSTSCCGRFHLVRVIFGYLDGDGGRCDGGS